MAFYRDDLGGAVLVREPPRDDEGVSLPGNCVNVAAADDGTVKLRESDDPDTVVATTPEKLRAFILGVKAGEFDHFAAPPSSRN